MEHPPFSSCCMPHTKQIVVTRSNHGISKGFVEDIFCTVLPDHRPGGDDMWSYVPSNQNRRSINRKRTDIRIDTVIRQISIDTIFPIAGNRTCSMVGCYEPGKMNGAVNWSGVIVSTATKD